LASIGEIGCVPNAKALVGYSGLGARVHVSGQTNHTGGITKQGRRELRTALIEAAWVAVRVSPGWKERHEQLAARLGTGKAITAIARKLLVTIWHVLSKAEADHAADPSAVARSMLLWGTKYRVASQQGLSRAAFVRERLQQVGLGGQLQELRYNGQVFKLSDADAQVDRSAPAGAGAAVASGAEHARAAGVVQPRGVVWASAKSRRADSGGARGVVCQGASDVQRCADGSAARVVEQL
jgi:hypothetical protein